MIAPAFGRELFLFLAAKKDKKICKIVLTDILVCVCYNNTRSRENKEATP